MNGLYTLYIRFMIWLGAAPPEGYEYLLPNTVSKAKGGCSSLSNKDNVSYEKNRFFSWVKNTCFGIIIEIVFWIVLGAPFVIGIFIILSDWLFWGAVGLTAILLALTYTVYKDWQHAGSLGIGRATRGAFVVILIGVLVGSYFGAGGINTIAAGAFSGAVIGAVVTAIAEFFIGFR
jgi:hypothetical protein